MKRKIHYVVTVATGFSNDTNWAFPFPVPYGRETHYTDLEIEFEQTGEDPLVDADEALKVWINENHPGMDYRIYYWTLEIL